MCQSKNNTSGAPSPCSACAKCKGKGESNCAAKKIARDLAREKKAGDTAPAKDASTPPAGE